MLGGRHEIVRSAVAPLIASIYAPLVAERRGNLGKERGLRDMFMKRTEASSLMPDALNQAIALTRCFGVSPIAIGGRNPSFSTRATVVRAVLGSPPGSHIPRFNTPSLTPVSSQRRIDLSRALFDLAKGLSRAEPSKPAMVRRRKKSNGLRAKSGRSR